jgi:hypothetical protein
LRSIFSVWARLRSLRLEPKLELDIITVAVPGVLLDTIRTIWDTRSATITKSKKWSECLSSGLDFIHQDEMNLGKLLPRSSVCGDERICFTTLEYNYNIKSRLRSLCSTDTLRIDWFWHDNTTITYMFERDARLLGLVFLGMLTVLLGRGVRRCYGKLYRDHESCDVSEEQDIQDSERYPSEEPCLRLCHSDR